MITMYSYGECRGHRVYFKMNTGADLNRVKAASVNPIDMKVRAGVYDDYAGEHCKI